MEQRNGRIDRHGQKADEVFIYHFLYADHEDSRFLETVVEKVQTMREDLGSVGDVIAEQVEKTMLGQRPRELEIPTQRHEMVKEIVKGRVLLDNDIREIVRHMNRARDELSLRPETMAMVLDEALKLVGHNGLEPATDPSIEGRAFRLRNLPTHWREAARGLTDTQGRSLDATFDHDLARDRRDVALLHLNHPLMKRALAVFRARLWVAHADQTGQALNRATYRVLSDDDIREPVVIAFGRLVATGALSQRLHEEVTFVGGEIAEREIYPVDAERLQELLRKGGEQPDISRSIGDSLRSFFPAHEKALQGMFAELEQAEGQRLSDLATLRADEDSNTIEELIKERINEINQRIKKESKDSTPPEQLALFDVDEYRQYQEDLEWLRRKRDDLRDRQKTEPGRVREAYQLKEVRVFPLGLLYLLPESLVKGA
jgi:hypothetical protein